MSLRQSISQPVKVLMSIIALCSMGAFGDVPGLTGKTDDGYTWTFTLLDGLTAEITDCSPKPRFDLKIPSELTLNEDVWKDGAKIVSVAVSGVGEGSCSNSMELTSVEFPNTSFFFHIRANAFSGCHSLTNIIMHEGLDCIRERAFAGCRGLKNVIVPESVNTIGEAAFSGCGSITNMVLPFVGGGTGTSSKYARFFGYIFGDEAYEGGLNCEQYYTEYYNYGSAQILYSAYIPEVLETLSIARGSIERGEMINCPQIKSIELQAGVTGIGLGSFVGCSGMTNFSACAGTGVSYPNEWTVAGVAFEGCSSVKRVRMPVNQDHGVSQYFPSCYLSIEEFEIPYGETRVGALTLNWWSGCGAFVGCTNLANVIIPETVTIIGKEAFKNCTRLVDVDLPDKLEIIGDSAFYGCKGLTNITIPNSVTNIRASAFYNCNSLTSVEFQGNPPAVESDVFRYVKSGAIGIYPAAHKAAWKAVIGSDGYWNGLKMHPDNYVDLGASSAFTDGIRLSWDVSSGLSGARYFVYRRTSENEPFVCLNGDTPISGGEFYDTTCLTGVNYYYRVDSESGVESEQIVGKRLARTTFDSEVSGIVPQGAPQLVDALDGDSLTFQYAYEAQRVGRVVAEAVLADRNGDFASRVVATNDVSEVGIKTNVISIAKGDIVGAAAGVPYALASLSLVFDIDGESPIYMDTESLTNIFWQVALPSFSPATKTVFFKLEQSVAISCATPAAEIRYTLDGSEPTEYSALYEGTFVISNSVTMKAKAFVEGMRPSATVQAEYVRAAIVGDNLVQNTSPELGVAQTLSVPAPGTYMVSFDYTQGSDIELCMVQGGVTNTVAVVSATTAGSTNFLFDVAAAGDYELTVYDLSSDASQPADVSNLNIFIPNTPENKGQYWIYETENTFGSTGEWIAEHGFKDGKMRVEDISTFTPHTKSDGRFVTVVTEVECDEAYEEDPDFDGKVSLNLCMTEGNVLVFRVLTMEDGVLTWKTVGAEGFSGPTLNTPYTVKLTLDCTNRTYTAAIIDGNVEIPLTHGTTNEFAFAGRQDTPVEQIEFSGEGNVMSLLGSYGNPATEFKRDDVLTLLDGQMSQALTEDQAAWLNSMKGYDAVRAKVATMGLDDFNGAYLLNLDISQSEFGLGMFKVTGIEVTESEVRISVTLNRTGAIQVSRDGTSRDAPINGLLKLYGGESPSDRTLLNATVITDANFGSGDTEVFTYPRSGAARFFRPAIVSP